MWMMGAEAEEQERKAWQKGRETKRERERERESERARETVKEVRIRTTTMNAVVPGTMRWCG